MNKKLILQIFLIVFTIIFTVFFLKTTFNKKEEELVQKENKSTGKKTDTNLIQGIQYFSKDIKGNTYLIESKSGNIDQQNPDIIYLTNVKAKINFDKKEEIFVTSNKAVYNVSNFDTEFIDNVKLIYKDNNLSCKNILVKFSENYAILSGNLVYNNMITSLYADSMEVDLISRKTKTSMFDKESKIKIIHNKDGIN
tara:strand:- start:286 stop:873 length:588 start_codon:yes stop_codon:yes gene_type:complete